LIVECLTDNRNRAANDVKLTLSKKGGSFAAPGSVSFQFENKGVVRLGSVSADKRDEVELALIDAGAEDIKHEEEETVVICPINDLSNITDACNNLSLDIKQAQIEWVPKVLVEADDESLETLSNLIDALEELDDVQNVFTNV